MVALRKSWAPAAPAATSCVAFVSAAISILVLGSQRQVPTTPAQPRVGGISRLSHSSRLDNGIRLLGSVQVGPPVRLMEALPPYAVGAEVVPVVYSFQFLDESEWRESSDGLFFRASAGREAVGFRTWIRGPGAAKSSDRTQVDVSILPLDGLSWTEVQTEHDIRVSVSEE